MDPTSQIAQLQAALLEKDARIAKQDAQIAELTEQVCHLARLVETLTEAAGRNSRNSNKPPSSDPPGRTGSGRSSQNTRKKRKRKRGGQVGHPGAHRALVPVEQVSKLENIFPSQCGNCWKQLPQTPDPKARRYQVTEVPPITPSIIEYRRHAVRCTCGYTTIKPFEDSQIPTSAFGPRLMSLVVLLTGVQDNRRLLLSHRTKLLWSA